MKIAFFEVVDWEKKIIKKALKAHDLLFFPTPLTKDNVHEIRDIDIISVFIYSKITSDILKKLPKLKLIATRSTGFDHIESSLPVANVPFYGENTVAEHTFALILSLSRNIHKAYVRGLRDDFSIQGLKGFDLKGKTIGVVGAGNIGLHVIKMAKGFSMNVLACDVNQNNFLAEVLGFEYVSLEELLSSSDIISLHVPSVKETKHLINKDNIKKIKKGSILINTSRGEVVDIDALIKALDNGILAGAGLDVLEGEELIKEERELLYEKENPAILKQLVKDHILLNKENVVYTPHIAFYSKEAVERILETTLDNILSFINKKPINIVRR